MSQTSAVVTGGGTGIGRAVARRLLRDGVNVTIAGRRADVLERAAAELRAEAADATVATVVVDVGEEAGPASLVKAHVEQFGQLDVLVAAAAEYTPCGFLDLTAEGWNRTMSINLRGAMLCASEAAKIMVANDGGRIVLVGSTNGFHAEPESVLYSVSKLALSSVARSIAVDLAKSGVTANVIAPGWTYTPITAAHLDSLGPDDLAKVNAVARSADADEIADVVRYLALEAPTYLTGQTIYVDGGQTIMAPPPPTW